MDLKALRYLVTLARTGSFLATARQHQVPPSSVSRFIAALEREVGLQLVFRHSRAVRLTEAGTQFEAQVREAVEALDAAAGQLAVQETAVDGLVRINAPQAFGRLHLSEPIHALQAAHPKLSVELTLTDAFVDPVQEGADIVVRIAPAIDSGLIGRAISASRYIVAASPAYLERYGTPLQPNALIGHNCLLYKGPYGAQKWYFRQGSAVFERAAVGGTMQSNSAETLVAAALAGRGIVMFPTWLLAPRDFTGNKLVSLLDDWEASATPAPTIIQLLSPENRLRSHRVRSVSNFLVTTFGNPPYWDHR